MTPAVLTQQPMAALHDPGARRAEELLARLGAKVLGSEPAADPVTRRSGLATSLMDEYRRTGSAEVFECLVALVSPQLLLRVRSRLRFLGVQLDPQEVLQDAIINIFRYPDRFDASRPGAFAAWSSTIVDNAIRRQIRRRRQAVVALSPAEVLAQHPDENAPCPDLWAQDREESVQTAAAYHLVLHFYLAAFQRLSERERFVLQMVEVKQMRYADLARVLGIRPEALKMVVFRARKRVHERMSRWFLGSGAPPQAGAALARAAG